MSMFCKSILIFLEKRTQKCSSSFSL